MILMASLLLSACLLTACVFDLRSERVPNTLILVGTALALTMHSLALLSGASPFAGSAWWEPLAGFAAGLALLVPLHLMGATGAGDVKLMAMVGAFVGVPAVLTAALYTLLAGGLLAVLFMLGRGAAAQAFSNLRLMLTHWAVRATTGQGARLEPLEKTAARLPYALAIAIGTGAAQIWPLGT